LQYNRFIEGQNEKNGRGGEVGCGKNWLFWSGPMKSSRGRKIGVEKAGKKRKWPISMAGEDRASSQRRRRKTEGTPCAPKGKR